MECFFKDLNYDDIAIVFTCCDKENKPMSD